MLVRPFGGTFCLAEGEEIQCILSVKLSRESHRDGEAHHSCTHRFLDVCGARLAGSLAIATRDKAQVLRLYVLPFLTFPGADEWSLAQPQFEDQVQRDAEQRLRRW